MGYHLREGFRSIFTHGLMSFAAVCMILACLIIMGSFSLVAINIDNTRGRYEAENEFIAYIDETLAEDEARALQSKLEAIPNVSSVTFMTAGEALERYTERYTDSETRELFDGMDDSVLRHRYRIHVDDLEQMGETVRQVEAVSGVAKVQWEQAISDGFVALRNVASAVAFILIAMLLVISLFIIANTIKLATFHRREEIAIMKMCGATNWFVRWPFLVEGVILGLAGGVIAYLCQWGVYGLIVQAVNKSGILSIINVVPFQQMAPVVLLVFLLVGVAIGAGGSAMAIRKFLKV